ncbi:MAG TPA: pyridoxamine 5'-phosphate oxidase family protein [Candidatus Kapabacteria bacterium]|nr:pyridoxamine 5'-phosphate oxidase family protein [Candidatus Kapabacteria bacterium]
MSKLHEEIGADLRAFIEAQQMFFVASAPLDPGGHVNLSPKGQDTLRVLGPRRLAYLDYVGSGAETIAHLRENGRIVIMMCTFAGAPKIVRFHGQGQVLEPQDREYAELRPLFPRMPEGRAIITISVERISDSCGFGVPLYEFQRQRHQMIDWAERKGTDGLAEYQVQKNTHSIDGLPALKWVERSGE